MSNEMVVMIGAVVAGVFVLGVLAMNAIRGVHGSLTNARVGEVYSFDYVQPLKGEPERILAEVIEPVHTLDESEIRRLNARSKYRYNDPIFKRTSHLVTCQMPNGDIRQFYAERTKNVRKTLVTNKFVRNIAAALL